MFAAVLDELKSPQNVGMIVRTHVAMGGPFIMIDRSGPWRFRKGTRAFSRKLERRFDIIYFANDTTFFDWCADEGWAPMAVEIRPDAEELVGMVWRERPALVSGNERG